MALNLLRSIGNMISDAGNIVASLSPFRHAPQHSDRSNPAPGLSNLRRSLGNIFVEGPATDIFSAERFEPGIEDETETETDDCENSNLDQRKSRSTRKDYWDRSKSVESITADLGAGCKCGGNCCHAMTVGTVIRCRAENAERTYQAQKEHASARVAGFIRKNTVRYDLRNKL